MQMNFDKLSEEEIIKNKDKICFTHLLNCRKLSVSTLEKLLGYINLKQTVMTQDLTPEFIVNFVLNEEYQEEDDEKTITINLILQHQKFSREDILDKLDILNLHDNGN
ncbi:putative ORFan [Tupanvirus deep ocean]|uniref:ORFan n=2 Tax=Tupanvirus TaxID=2094720 RepID=A0AC62A8K3_9VIRU|nr:putative ORFan [Tupanvirus deep ocean]QKU34109.1 putative ORFan [Tupanvirus deep ocean]